MKFKQKNHQIQIRDPVLLEDGSMVFDVTLTTDNPDRDGDIINPLGVQGVETAVIAYNHQKCNGIPVSTGASIVKDSIVKTQSELRLQIKVSQTDEMFFCDISGVKKSNGKLLEAITKNHANNISMGFRYNPEDVQIKYIGGIRYSYYNKVILDEFSILDVLSSNPNSVIHKTPNIMKTELQKQKCLECLRNGGVGTVAVNGDGNYVKVTEVTDTEVKGKNFDGEEFVLDDTYETVLAPEMHKEAEMSTNVPAVTEAPADPALQKQVEELTKQITTLEAEKCGCSLNKKEEKDVTDIATIPDVIDPEEIGADIKIQTILDNQATIISELESIKQMLETTSKVADTDLPAVVKTPEAETNVSETIKSEVEEAVKMSMDKFISLSKTEEKPTNQYKLNLF